ncbi:hypothetical protein FQN57_001765 [Myotisia sp. PD_48]|nr:hypothetical protein FQN57_001765 [Myotisia sp. PD_48]
MGSDDGTDPPRKRRRVSPPETGPYVLRPFLDQIPVTLENVHEEDKAYITCVEYWNENLYVGTSAGEILHFVSLPADPASASDSPTLILASRRPIDASSRHAFSMDASPGIQQILILPTASKACILCNGIVTFYSLPELSSAYDSSKVVNCSWIGGLDLNLDPDQYINGEAAPDPVVLLGLRHKIMIVTLKDVPRARYIEFPGCLAASRRGSIVCVANSNSYALLEVEHRQKIMLFPISSEQQQEEPNNTQGDNTPTRSASPAHSHSVISNGNFGPSESKAHGRSSSLNVISTGSEGRQSGSKQAAPEISNSVTTDSTESNFLKPGYPTERRASTPGRTSTSSPDETSSTDQKPLPPPPPPKPTSVKLKPHILSPTSSEFLLVTGAGPSDPGVGIFVNLDGETAERGTMEFRRYPSAMVLDNGDDEAPGNDEREGYVLAVISLEKDGGSLTYLETQRWDVNPGEGERQRSFIEIPASGSSPSPVGISRTVSPGHIDFTNVGELLQSVRLKTPSLQPGESTPPENLEPDPRTKASIEQHQKEKELFDSQETDSDGSRQPPTSRLQRGWEAEKNQEEAKFAKTLGHVKSNLILWEGDRIWRVLPNPLALQLENALRLTHDPEGVDSHQIANKDAIISLIKGLGSILPRTATESIGLGYVKQKASLLLFGDLIATDPADQTPGAIAAVEDALISGELDPRIILLLTPLLKDEIFQGSQGIWVYAGLTELVDKLSITSKTQEESPDSSLPDPILRMLVRYLNSWQRKRGYGSVTADTYLFNSVDSALLHLLLHIDSLHIQSNGTSSNTDIRTDLNKLVDTWKGNFDRAVELLERYQRLFVLSRLYQSRKLAGHVLGTWRRMIEGAPDLGGELSHSAVEVQMRKYLVKIRDPQLVQDYALWLATQNQQLGVQVFSDDNSRVKFEPAQVIDMLKAHAPGTVQIYLEHLVFVKKLPQYTDHLISYYLDSVLSVLESSSEARASLSESYSTYRALQSPKPSYLTFITQNAPAEPWWQSRLRLLQLLGGGTTSQFTSLAPVPTILPYSISAVLSRVEPFKNELVSECIILGGRQGRHLDALHLLTHGLGDYDSAIRYCLFEGPTEPSSTASQAVSSTGFSPSPSQKELFSHLLREFMKISELPDRLEQTSDLLARFSPLFDIDEVLEIVPSDWSVDLLSEFLSRVLRGLVSDSRSAKIQKALSAGLNLRVSAEFVESTEKLGGWIERDGEVRPLKEVSKAVEQQGNDDTSKQADLPEQLREDDTLFIS